MLIININDARSCNNYTLNITGITPLNLFACIIRRWNKRPSFIDAVIYIYDHCTFKLGVAGSRRQRWPFVAWWVRRSPSRSCMKVRGWAELVVFMHTPNLFMLHTYMHSRYRRGFLMRTQQLNLYSLKLLEMFITISMNVLPWHFPSSHHSPFSKIIKLNREGLKTYWVCVLFPQNQWCRGKLCNL